MRAVRKKARNKKNRGFIIRMWSSRGHTACFLCRWFDNKVAGGEKKGRKKKKKKSGRKADAILVLDIE